MGLMLGLLGVGTLLQLAGTVSSVSAQNKAADAQLAAQEDQQKQQELTNSFQRRQAIRESQILRADAQSAAAGSGAGGGSGAIGGIGSLGSQLGSVLGTGSQLSALSQQIFENNQLATRYGGRAQLGGAVAGFGSQLSGFAMSRGATYGGLYGLYQPTGGNNNSR